MSTLPERFAWIFDHRRTNPGALSEAGDDPNPTQAPASPSPPPVSDTVTTLDATDERQGIPRG